MAIASIKTPMQGTLSEIDIRSILSLLELGQKTGTLLIEANPPGSSGSKSKVWEPYSESPKPPAGHSWFVFFANGKIVYATDSITSLTRLNDYLRRYQAEVALTRLMAAHSMLEQNALEYDCLWLLLNHHVLHPSQGRNIIHCTIRETLFDLFRLPSGRFIFAADTAIAPQLTTLTITPHLAQVVRQVQQWKQLYPYIHSPEQCPAIAATSSLQNLLSHRTINKFSEFADGTTSIRQIARYLHRNLLSVARAIYPYVQRGAIQLSPLNPNQQDIRGESKPIFSSHFSVHPSAQKPTILCVDDDADVQEMVKSTLSSYGYCVSAIANSLDIFGQIFQVQADLILCNAEMSNLSGYEICAMLRQITAFQERPIIILISSDNPLNRARAKVVGATDVLTKPFRESELLPLISKYVGIPSCQQSQSTSSVANPSDDRLQIERMDASSISSTPLN
jgi:twitching motility two-component system response regulator PilG